MLNVRVILKKQLSAFQINIMEKEYSEEKFPPILRGIVDEIILRGSNEVWLQDTGCVLDWILHLFYIQKHRRHA